MKKVTIIDYGIGNILSVKRAFEFCGAEVELTDMPDKVACAEYLILPGVGAFADGMKGLRQRKLVDAIHENTSKGHPFMGICLGMQMMLEESEEFGVHKGLGLIPGKVLVIPSTTIEGESHKIPHIGWNELRLPQTKTPDWWCGSILSNSMEGDAAYFVHSFTAVPTCSEHRLADVYYGGRLISAVIRKGNIYGCQFHPEKSGEVGLKIIRAFLQLA